MCRGSCQVSLLFFFIFILFFFSLGVRLPDLVFYLFFFSSPGHAFCSFGYDIYTCIYIYIDIFPLVTILSCLRSPSNHFLVAFLQLSLILLIDGGLPLQMLVQVRSVNFFRSFLFLREGYPIEFSNLRAPNSASITPSYKRRTKKKVSFPCQFV